MVGLGQQEPVGVHVRTEGSVIVCRWLWCGLVVATGVRYVALCLHAVVSIVSQPTPTAGTAACKPRQQEAVCCTQAVSATA